MKRSILSIVSLFFTGSTAIAGGLGDPVIEPPIPPITEPNDWYVGVQLGAGAGTATGDFTPDVGVAEEDIDGALYGVHAGVQRRFGPYQLGVEVDYNAAEIVADTLADDPFDITTAEIDTLAHLKLRAGAVRGPAFFYGTAGLAYAEGTMNDTAVSDTTGFFGVGADVQVSPRFSVGAEVLHHNFDDIDGSGYDVELTTAQLRASFHF